MRKYNYLFFFLVMSFFVKPIPGAAQLKVYQSHYLSLDSSLQHTSEKKARLKILQAMIDDLLVFSNSLTPDQSKAFFEKKMTEFLLLQKEMGNKDLRAYELWLTFRNYRVSPKPDPRHSLDLLIEMISEFDKQKKSIPNFLSAARGYFNDLNEQEARLVFYEKKVKEYTVNNQKQNLAAALFGLAGYYSAKGEHNRAISYYELSADLYKDFLTYSYINQLGVIGRQYALWGNTAKANSFIDSAINVKRRTGILIFTPESSAADVALQLKDYHKALTYCRKILQYDVSKTSIVITKVHMAICEANLNQVKEAQSHLQEAILLSDSLKMPIYSAVGSLEFDYVKYLCARKKHNYPQALQYLNLALQKFSDLKIPDLQKKYLTELLDFYTETGAYSQYFTTSKKLDSLNNLIESGLAPLKIASYETEQKERRQTDSLSVLKEEKAIQQAVLNKNTVMLWISLLGLLIISIALYFVYRQSLINKKTLANLRSTQSQLIQSEKMASLGELTAGIAHEIQNPLNFVNNFSELSLELMEEVKSEKSKVKNERDEQLEDELLNDIASNLEKINHHGKRADAIVKGMMQHSRSSSGQKEPTDINALCDEYLRLAYHGLRAKDKDFNASFETKFDDSIGTVNIQPQEIGRVVLNLINNAFYAVTERKMNAPDGYEPSVKVSTEQKDNNIFIRVQDNGTGIPQKVMDKIFQPFFTTKPTGQGTGLGLSLSYDIVKAHGGEITVSSKINEGSEFIISIPNNSN